MRLLSGNGRSAIHCSAVVGLRASALFPPVLRRSRSSPGPILNLGSVRVGWAMTDPNFRRSSPSPTTCRSSLLIFCVGFFTWLAMRQAVINDERIAQGEPPLEKLDDEKVLVWPDLVYTELICMVVLTIVLVVWAIVLKAPLEQPATSAKAPNPSKAPWYFLGLQEMLVYFDPWMAGVVLPSHDHRRPDGHSVHRLQQEGQRLLHLQRAQVRRTDVPCSASSCCG